MLLQDLFESIPLSQAKKYMRLNNSAQYDELFNKFKKYGRKNPKLQRLYIPLKDKAYDSNKDYYTCANILGFIKNAATAPVNHMMSEQADREIYNNELDNSTKAFIKKLVQIKKLLFPSNAYSQHYEDYIKGVVPLSDNQTFKIGKILSGIVSQWQAFVKLYNSNEIYQHSMDDLYGNFLEKANANISRAKVLLSDFQNDPIRSSIRDKNKNWFVVISRNPVDIAGMSTGRGWTSCTNLIDGAENEYVGSYVSNANLIAYLIREGDWNIERPAARQLICRYNNEKIGNYIFWPQENYGFYSDAFNETVEKFCKIANKGKSDKIYTAAKNQQYPESIRKYKNKYNMVDYG